VRCQIAPTEHLPGRLSRVILPAASEPGQRTMPRLRMHALLPRRLLQFEGAMQHANRQLEILLVDHH